MSLKEKIQKDFNFALKNKREAEICALRMLKAAIVNKEKEKKYKEGLKQDNLKKESELSDEEIAELVFSEIKKRKEAIVEFEKGKRFDLALKEKKEIEVLEKYLPRQLSAKEIEDLARETIKKIKAKNLKDFGATMKELMPKIKGKADGSLVSKIVKEILSC